MDKIIITDLEVFAHHGVLAEEKRDGQMFYLDIVLELDLSRACADDSLDSTVNYDEVCKAAGEAMTAANYDLIERAAQVTAERLLADFSTVRSVDITLKKPSAPLCRKVGYVAVNIRRERGAVQHGAGE